ncbi:helix-turn-helix domain-containing protein [Pararoseomonas sp. SCSIO 73927]|uniref:AraC family transcriptional regulator n=1 Tax=Pararoseomonas sp. SCSIO 73927 TaxID=3114537 RepID=UPI0030D4C986
MRTRIGFASFEAYAAHAPGLSANVMLQARGTFGAQVSRVRGCGLLAVAAKTTLAHTARALTPAREVFAFCDAGPRSLVLNGVAYPHGTILWIPGGIEIHYRDPGEVRAWSLSFAREDFTTAVHALLGQEMTAAGDPMLLSPEPGILRGIMTALQLVMDGTTELRPPLVGAVLQGIVSSLPSGRPPEPTAVRRRNLAAGLVALADTSEGQPLALADICRALGVSLRTLNTSAQDVLGMNASRYLRRRRLHAVHRALREGLAASVTQAATEHGFFELGRFAADYRDVFGELPSATLHAWQTGWS